MTIYEHETRLISQICELDPASDEYYEMAMELNEIQDDIRALSTIEF